LISLPLRIRAVCAAAAIDPRRCGLSRILTVTGYAPTFPAIADARAFRWARFDLGGIVGAGIGSGTFGPPAGPIRHQGVAPTLPRQPQRTTNSLSRLGPGGGRESYTHPTRKARCTDTASECVPQTRQPPSASNRYADGYHDMRSGRTLLRASWVWRHFNRVRVPCFGSSNRRPPCPVHLRPGAGRDIGLRPVSP